MSGQRNGHRPLFGDHHRTGAGWWRRSSSRSRNTRTTSTTCSAT